MVRVTIDRLKAAYVLFDPSTTDLQPKSHQPPTNVKPTSHQPTPTDRKMISFSKEATIHTRSGRLIKKAARFS